jgi:predicted Zn-dependent peptidase
MKTQSTDLEFHRFEFPLGIRLSILPTRKLKTVIAKAYFTGNLDESVTQKALVPMVLRRGTRNFPDLQAINRHLENLYGSSLTQGIVKVGEWHVACFRLEAVNGRFLPEREDVIGKVTDFLKEMLFEPHLQGELLHRQFVEQEKQNLGRIIDSLVDSKDQYVLERLIQNMCSSEPFRHYEYGRKEDLPEIEPETLTSEWRTWSTSYPIDLYVSGDVDVSRSRDLFQRVFSVPRKTGMPLSGPPGSVEVGEPRFLEERMAVHQGKLCLGFRHGISYFDGDLEAAVVMNGILGAFSHSKLFQNVREKASLAYDVHSALEKTKGLLFVLGGIAPENYQQAFDIILEQVKAIQDGHVTDEEMTSTKESLDNSLCMMEDNLSSLLEVDFVWQLHGRSFDLKEYRSRLREITRERVVEAARRLKLDTVYFLRN